MIRTLLFDHNMCLQSHGGEEQIRVWHNNPDMVIWVDLFEEAGDTEHTLLTVDFGLHPLAITDAQRTRHPAKIEGFSDNTFMLFKGLSEDTNSIDFNTIQIALFVSDRFLVTRHSGVSDSINKLWEEILDQSENERLSKEKSDPAGLALNLIRFIVNRYLPILLNLENRLEEIEIEFTQNPQDSLLFELIDHKSHLKKMRRIMAYHTVVFEQLKKHEWVGIKSDSAHEINDVYEQLERATSLAGLYHELASDLQDGYISLASHKLNNIVKLLTIITVIFIPLGFLAGLYGMNFEYIPELKSKYGYFILLSVMASIAIGLLVLFKKIKWL